MKKLFLILALTFVFSTLTFAGDMPNVGKTCTGNCLVVSTVDVPINNNDTDIFSLIFKTVFDVIS